MLYIKLKKNILIYSYYIIIQKCLSVSILVNTSALCDYTKLAL